MVKTMALIVSAHFFIGCYVTKNVRIRIIDNIYLLKLTIETQEKGVKQEVLKDMQKEICWKLTIKIQERIQ